MPTIPDESSERSGEADRNQQDRQDLDDIAQRGGVLERVRRVGSQDPATVGAEFLDRFLGRDGGQCIGDRIAVEAGGGETAVERLDHSLAQQDQGDHEGEREEDAQRTTRQIDPEVADLAAPGHPNEAANQCDGHRHADRCRDEVLHRQTDGLNEVAHRRFRRVRLPVGVRHKRNRGVERYGRTDPGQTVTQRQYSLNPLQEVQEQCAGQRESENACGVAVPRLLGPGVDPTDAVDHTLDPQISRRRVNTRHVVAHRNVGDCQNDEDKSDLQAGCKSGRHQNLSGSTSATSR